MRKAIIAAAVALAATVSFAAPSQAGGVTIGFSNGTYGHGWSGQIGYVDGYYGNGYYEYRPYCFIKKVRRYDAYGNVYYERVRICR